MKHNQAKFRALGNMGDVLMKMEAGLEEAMAVYQKQLGLAKAIRDKGFEAAAYGALGVCHRQAKLFDKSLGFHTQVSFLLFGLIFTSHFEGKEFRACLGQSFSLGGDKELYNKSLLLFLRVSPGAIPSNRGNVLPTPSLRATIGEKVNL